MRTRDQSDTVQLSKIRMKETLRAALERDASSRARTMNAAIVDRLEQSFAADSAYGGPRTAALLRSLAALIRFHRPHDDDDAWLFDRTLFNEVVDLWNHHLDRVRPEEALADTLERQREMAEFRHILSTAAPEVAKVLRRQAARHSTIPGLDPAERAEWAALAKGDEQ